MSYYQLADYVGRPCSDDRFCYFCLVFFFSSRRRHTRCLSDWSSDVCSSDLDRLAPFNPRGSDVAVVLDLMIHDIDLVRTFVGGGVASIAAVGVPVLTPFVDIANARISFEAGAVANITASRVSRERMRKLRIFQQSGYLSLDLAAGTGEFYRLRRDVDLVALVRQAQGAQALETFVERVTLEAADGEPLRLELQNFLEAVRGRAEIAVSGDDGREALAVALTIVREIERTLPALASRA